MVPAEKNEESSPRLSTPNSDQKPPTKNVLAEEAASNNIGHTRSNVVTGFMIYEPQSAQSSTPYKLPPYIHRPCCTNMQTAMYLIAGGEVVVYSIIVSVYTIWYNNFLNPENRRHFEQLLFLAGRRLEQDSTEAITKFLASLSMVEIIVCCLYMLASSILVIGAAKRNAVLCWLWIFLVSCFIVTRVVVLILTPMIRIFQWGILWTAVEMYFMYCVGCFIREVRFFPKGYSYHPPKAGQEFSESRKRIHGIPLQDLSKFPNEGRLDRFHRRNSIHANRPIIFYQTYPEV